MFESHEGRSLNDLGYPNDFRYPNHPTTSEEGGATFFIQNGYVAPYPNDPTKSEWNGADFYSQCTPYPVPGWLKYRTSDEVVADPIELRPELCFPSCPDSEWDFALGRDPPFEKRPESPSAAKKLREESDKDIMERFLDLFILQEPSLLQQLYKDLTPRVERGQFFDVISLLKDSGSEDMRRVDGSRVEVESLRGKYIVVCCLLVPILYSHCHGASLEIRALSLAFSELSDRSDTEIVAVVKMRPRWDSDKIAFNHFIKALPGNCLVVPSFEQSVRCDCIFRALGYNGFPNGIFLCPEQKVLLRTLSALVDYGPSEAFPFTKQKLNDLRRESRLLSSKLNSSSPCSLHQLLGCRPTDLLHRINIDGNEKEPVVIKPISELEGKIVGVYLFLSDPMFLPELCEIYHHCKDRDMEIVVVCFPDLVSCNRLDFESLFIEALRKLKVACWFLPFNYSVTRRLRRLTDFDDERNKDKFIILGPNGEYSDYFGAEIIDRYGLEAFPYTSRQVVQFLCDKLREPTLTSLLTFEKRDYVIGRGCTDTGNFVEKLDSLESFKGKYVVLSLFDLSRRFDFHDEDICNRACEQYNMVLKYKHHNDIEMVAVFSGSGCDESDLEHYRRIVPRIPCWVCPFDPEHSKSASLSKFMDAVYKSYARSALFDREGRACSIVFGTFSKGSSDELQSEVLLALAQCQKWFRPLLDNPNYFGSC